jgi:hypothetical protein
MESRSLEPSTDPEDLDVYAQLQQKENDLILAAELGKALLEKNEELSRQNEKLAEDYSQKLEVSVSGIGITFNSWCCIDGASLLVLRSSLALLLLLVLSYRKTQKPY